MNGETRWYFYIKGTDDTARYVFVRLGHLQPPRLYLQQRERESGEWKDICEYRVDGDKEPEVVS